MFRGTNCIKIGKEGALNEMQKLCNENGVYFLVTFLDSNENTTELKERLDKEHISTTEVGFDFTDCKITNLPYDSHPNKDGHIIIAKKISATFSSMLGDEE